MNNLGLESLRSKFEIRYLSTFRLSTKRKIMVQISVILPVAIRILLIKLLLAQVNEFLLEIVWMLDLVPAILIPYHFGLHAGLLAAFFLWTSGIAIEGISLALGYNTYHLLFHAMITLTSMSLVAVITGILVDRLQRKQALLNTMAQNVAMIEERHKIGRELHDTVAQTLPTIKLKLLLAIRQFDSHQVQEGCAMLRELDDILQREIANIRCFIADFKYDIACEKSVYMVLHDCVEKARRYYDLDIEVQVTRKAIVDLPLEVNVQLVRIVQEALTNIRKHAKTNKAYFYLSSEPEFLYLKIEDHGCGFDMHTSSQEKYGLSTMRERARMINALIEINSTPKLGTSVTVTVTLKPGEVKTCGKEKSIIS